VEPENLSSLKSHRLFRTRFTTCCTIVCPQSLLSAVDADHAPDKVVEMFNSVWNRSSKAKELGCVELQEGIPVFATKFIEGFAAISLSENKSPSMFTVENELTNKVPGQSDNDAGRIDHGAYLHHSKPYLFRRQIATLPALATYFSECHRVKPIQKATLSQRAVS